MSACTPFDGMAADYDARFSDRLPGAWLRFAVRARIAPLLEPGMPVLELGCGTGDDAIWLAQNGCRVLATDASANMLAVARRKAGTLGVLDDISFRQLDLATAAGDDLPAGFRAGLVFSNFGALNCVENLRPAVRLANGCLTDRGHLALTVMGRFCLWETLWFGARGRFRTAVRRWNGQSHYRVGGECERVWYHSPRAIRRQATDFRQVGLFGIGGLLPGSEGFDLCERWPGLFGWLAEQDRRLAPWLAPVSDHFLLIAARRGAVR